MCIADGTNPDIAAKIIARRLLLCFPDLRCSPMRELAPIIRCMVENSWDELAAAAHVIHNNDRNAERERVYEFNGWM